MPVSVLFRRPLTPTAARLFSFIASLAIGDAIRDEGLLPANRWPNDVLLDGKKSVWIAMSPSRRSSSGPTAQLLLLVNYRPEYRHGWGSKTYYRQVRIDPLPAESADELLRL